MKRIVILIDGTWNKEGIGFDTNIALLHQDYHSIPAPLIKPRAADGVEQKTFYNKGVGTESDIFQKLLGGAIGWGLKDIIQTAYQTLVSSYEPGDDIYIIGFSRGAYAARALAGLIGASGVQRQNDKKVFDAAWKNYRVKPAVRAGVAPAGPSDKAATSSLREMTARHEFHNDRAVKCVGVFDTVGSYGIPAGIGLAPLARYVAVESLGFHDTEFGKHVEFGFHAIGIDERRRPFVPTFWTKPKNQEIAGRVEQTWFAGVHCNIGGGYKDAGLSNDALVWMLARMQAETGLEFDADALRAAVSAPMKIEGEVYDSSIGWMFDRLYPHQRVMLSPDAIEHGLFTNRANPKMEQINERIHRSAIDKIGRLCTYCGAANTQYKPENFPSSVPPLEIAELTPEEKLFWA